MTVLAATWTDVGYKALSAILGLAIGVALIYLGVLDRIFDRWFDR